MLVDEETFDRIEYHKKAIKDQVTKMLFKPLVFLIKGLTRLINYFNKKS